MRPRVHIVTDCRQSPVSRCCYWCWESKHWWTGRRTEQFRLRIASKQIYIWWYYNLPVEAKGREEMLLWLQLVGCTLRREVHARAGNTQLLPNARDGLKSEHLLLMAGLIWETKIALWRKYESDWWRSCPTSEGSTNVGRGYAISYISLAYDSNRSELREVKFIEIWNFFLAQLCKKYVRIEEQI